MNHWKRLLFATAFLSAPGLAFAAAPDAGAGQRMSTVEEVVVTAQKREQRAIDVPIAITAIGQESLEKLGFTNITDIAQSIPSLSIQPYPNSSSTLSITIRGVGQVDALQLARDPGVAIYLDDVNLAHGQGVTTDLGDIERVEVLRGPQGTLYGRNSVGGAIKFITAAPTGKFGFKEVFDAGDFGYVRSGTYVNLPEVNGFSAKLSYVRSTKGGWVDNPGPGDNYGEADQEGYRVALRWRPSDALTADYVYDHSKQNGAGLYQQRISHFAELFYPFATPGPFTERLDTAWRASSIPEHDDFVQSGHALTVAWSPAPNVTLKSITSYRQIDTDQLHDSVEAFNLPAVLGQVAHDHQFSQEFLLTGSAFDDHVKYNLGAFYFNEGGHQAFLSIANPFALLVDPLNPTYAYRPPTVADIGPPQLGDIRNKSKAVYGQVSWTPELLGERLTFDLGGRYSEDDRALVRTTLGVVDSGKSSYSSFDPSAAVNLKITDNVRAYFRYATAYRSGGFSIYAGSSPFAPENLTSYEVGLKALFWDRRVQFDVAAFRQIYDDIQLDFFTPTLTGVVTVNAGKAVVKGVESNLDAVLAPGLKVGGSLSYLESSSDVTDPFFGTHTLGSLPFTPKWKYDIHADYAFPPLPFGVVSAYVAWTFNGSELESIGVSSSTDHRGAFHLLNARLTLSEIPLARGDLSISLWGNNLTNTEYEQWVGFGAAIFGQPRNYGVNLTYKY